MNPVRLSERRGVTNPPKLGGYLNRVPSENTTLFFPSIMRSGKDGEEQRHVSNATTIESNINLGENAARNVRLNDYERDVSVNITTASVVATSLQGDGDVQAGSSGGDGDVQAGTSGGDGDSLSPPSEVVAVGTEREGARGSQVYWGSEDGVVHMGMRPRHRPRKHLRVKDKTEPSALYETTHVTSTQETTRVTSTQEPLEITSTQETTLVTSTQELPEITSTQELLEITTTQEALEITTTQEALEITSTQELPEITSTQELPEITSTQELLESSTAIPGGWTTDTPEADWTTDTPEATLTGAPGRLTNHEDAERNEHQESSRVAEEMEVSTQINDLSTYIPDEYLTVSPEEWLTSTLQDDWLTFTPQDEDLMDTQEEILLTSLFNPTPLPLSPTLTSSLPPFLTPTLPPSLPPTPSPQDVMEDSFRITTRGLDFLLEASPTGQSSDTTEFPKDDLFTHDLTITTTREGLKVDARDVTLDPSQIAKATSYEGSSYPTATRSATVTTTWVDEDEPRSVDPQRVNLRTGELGDVGSHEGFEAADGDLLTLPIDALLGETSDTPRSESTAFTHSLTTEEADVDSATPPAETPLQEQAKEQDITETLTRHEIHQGNSSARSRSFPVLVTNVTDARNESMVKGNDTQETVVYEMPVVTRNPGPQLSPSVVVALSVCCAVVLVLAALSVALWICRRHRNRSKIYLSREAAKPRAFFTRPMNPAMLPEDSDREDAVYMFEFQRPRPPILLGDDQKGIYFIKRDKGEDECRASLGVENEAFSDVPLGEAADEGQTRLDPPKYDQRGKQDSDADSGIRVWSSTGSLHAAASPLPAHCRVPPPQYSPSISKESVCLAVHSLPSLPRNSQLFDV